MQSTQQASARITCTQCLRPTTHCLCSTIVEVEHRTQVLILQHPDEQKHPLNTARLAVLGLKNASLWVGESFEQLPQRLSQVDQAILLFPAHEGSVTQPLEPLTMNSSSLLLVPDGTWRNVRKIMRLNPLLQTLPRLSLPMGEPSLYRVRKAREQAAVSTIEAVVRSLTVLEPEQNFTPILAPFHRLIEQQIESMGAELYGRNYG